MAFSYALMAFLFEEVVSHPDNWPSNVIVYRVAMIKVIIVEFLFVIPDPTQTP
jgi:hypothetical protein